jgi:hypothetical protein
LQPSVPKHTALLVTEDNQHFDQTSLHWSQAFDSARPSGDSANVAGPPQTQSPRIMISPLEPSHPRQRLSGSPQVTHFVTQTADDSGRTPLIFPPPFTLQPEPRWDTLSENIQPFPFTEVRTESQVTRESSFSPVSRTREQINTPRAYPFTGPEPPSIPSESVAAPPVSRAASTPSIRGGRYDRVRDTFIPYAASGSSPTPPLSKRHLDDDTNDTPSPSREEL